MSGLDRLVGVRVDAERDADEGALDPGRRGELGLVRRVEHDRRADRGCLGEERGVLVVPVDDEVVAGEPGGLGECELAARRDVRADSFLAQEPQERDVREGLRPEEDTSVADRRTERPRLGAERRLAEHDERRAVLLGELRCGDPADRELSVARGGRVGEQVEHGAARGSGRCGGVSLAHRVERERLVLACVSRLAEVAHALRDQRLHRRPRRLQVVARVELLGRLGEHLPDRTCHREARVGVDVDLADAVADPVLDLLDGNAPGGLELAAVTG